MHNINKGIPSILYLKAVYKSKLSIALNDLVRPHPGQQISNKDLNKQFNLTYPLVAINIKDIPKINISKL